MRHSHLAPTLALAALLGTTLGAQATVHQFNAMLDPGNEVGVSTSLATGVAFLSYNDMGTVMDLGDDVYNFAMSVFDLSGGATGFHIHGAATTTENGPVRIGLDGVMFTSFNTGGILLVGGNNVPMISIDGGPIGMIPATAASGTNAGHPAMSFLAMLKGGLAYANVHTAADPAGATRGQFVEVTVVPEPASYAMLLGGLGLVGLVASRRRKH